MLCVAKYTPQQESVSNISSQCLEHYICVVCIFMYYHYHVLSTWHSYRYTIEFIAITLIESNKKCWKLHNAIKGQQPPNSKQPPTVRRRSPGYGQSEGNKQGDWRTNLRKWSAGGRWRAGNKHNRIQIWRYVPIIYVFFLKWELKDETGVSLFLACEDFCLNSGHNFTTYRSQIWKVFTAIFKKKNSP